MPSPVTGAALSLREGRDRQTGDMALQSVRLAQFVIYGTAPRHGFVLLDTDLEPVVEAPGP